MKVRYEGGENKTAFLTIGKAYTVLEVYHDDRHGLMFRIIDDENISPVLFAAGQFVITSSLIPKEWIIKVKQNGYFELTPEPWSRDGFWEAYFNDDPEAVKAFDDVCRQLLVCES